MDLQLTNSYLKVTAVYLCLIKYTPNTIVKKKAFWPWEEDEVEIQNAWTLELQYAGHKGNLSIYTNGPTTDHDLLKREFDMIMSEIKAQDSQYADKLLENAIIGGGSK